MTAQGHTGPPGVMEAVSDWDMALGPEPLCIRCVSITISTKRKGGKERGKADGRGEGKREKEHEVQDFSNPQPSGEHPLIKDWMITSSNIYKWF